MRNKILRTLSLCMILVLCLNFVSAETVSCQESDGGRNYYVKGSACMGDVCKTDYCSGNNLVEFYIEEEGIIGDDICDPLADVFSVTHECAYGCEDGRCLQAIEEVEEPACTDSDSGRDYYEKGTVIWYVPDFNEFWEETDKCRTTPDGDNTYSGDYLIEMTCEGKIGDNPLGTALSAVTYKCPNSCENGACLSKESEEENLVTQYIRCDIKGTLTEGMHKVYSVGGREYEIELTYVGGYGTPLANGGVSSGTVVLVVNGETFKLGTANNYIGALSDGSRIQVVGIIQDEVADKIVFCFEGAVAPIIEEPQEVIRRDETEPIILPVDLRYYPKFLAKDEQLNAYIIVGDSAPASDVMAATDISASLQSNFGIEVGAVKLISDFGRKISENNNFIIVGKEANGKLGLVSYLESLNEGEGLIQIIRDRNYVLLSVTGYTNLDVRNAAKVLSKWQYFNLRGDRVKVKTDAQGNLVLSYPPYKTYERPAEDIKPEPIDIPTRPEPTCYDGIKNDGETGVDCGGPCKPCPAIEKPCSGCKKNGDCLPFGIRIVEEDVPKYCSITKQFKIQKGADGACQNNYECSTNLCIDNKCISSNLISRILNWFKRFFS